MSSWLKCCGILDHTTDIYLACYGSWEKYFCCQTLDMLLCSVNSNILKIRKGKHEWIKWEQSQSRLSRSTWTLKCSNKPATRPLCPPVSCSRAQTPPTRAPGLMTYRLGQTQKKMFCYSVKNNTICNQNKWMGDNALISQLPQPSLELLLKKWHSLLWSHPKQQLVTTDLLMFSFMVFSCWQWTCKFYMHTMSDNLR